RSVAALRVRTGHEKPGQVRVGPGTVGILFYYLAEALLGLAEEPSRLLSRTLVPVVLANRSVFVSLRPSKLHRHLCQPEGDLPHRLRERRALLQPLNYLTRRQGFPEEVNHEFIGLLLMDVLRRNRCRIPNPHGLVDPARSQAVAVGAEGETEDPCSVAA